MQSVIKSSVSIIASTLAMMVVPQLTQAADDYVVISRGQTRVGDNVGTNPRVFSFSLPTNVSLSSAIARSAVLQYSVRHTQFEHNEIYINPSNPGCFSDSSDGNQSHSIDNIEDYDADDDMLDDFFTVHVVFNSNLLKPGANTLVVCARNESGGTTGNLDDFFIADIVLHYKTN